MQERTLITGNDKESMVQSLATYFAQRPDAFSAFANAAAG